MKTNSMKTINQIKRQHLFAHRRNDSVKGNNPLTVYCAKDPADDDVKYGNGNATDVLAKSRPRLAKPPLFKVLMVNDDYTPMEFVVHALETYFDKSPEEAMQIMLSVHNKGVGICGVFTRDVADTKAHLVVDLARSHGHPLLCKIEQA